MTKYSFLGAVVVAASALASPAMAQQVIYNPGYCAQFYPNANCQNLGPGNPYTGGYQQRAAYQQNRWNGGWNNSYNRWDNGNPYAGGYQRRAAYQQNGWNGGWNNSYNRWDNNDWRYRRGPGDVAAGVVGGAIGTAGAIATAPFAAYDNGQSYAQRNGLVCTPGTWFRGEDGRRHLCQ